MTQTTIPSAEAVEKMMATTAKGNWLELAVGEKVVGKIVEKKMASIGGGDERLLYVIETATGTYALKNRVSLYSKIEEQGGEVGKLVYIRYNGEKPSTKRRGATYFDYTVKVFTNEDLVDFV